MSLNAILNHLETTEQEAAKKDRGLDEPQPALNGKQREYAERIFFGMQLRECNAGMAEEKFRSRVRQAVERAKILYEAVYGKGGES